MKTKRMLALTAMILLIALAFSACAPKSAITKEDFVSKAKSLGYEIEDDTPVDDEEYSYVLSSTLAMKKDISEDNWLAMFVVSKTKEDAKGMFTYNRDEYANGVSTGVSETTTDNSATYEANKDGKFIYISYVDATMLILEVDSGYKDEAKKLISELGY